MSIRDRLIDRWTQAMQNHSNNDSARATIERVLGDEYRMQREADAQAEQPTHSTEVAHDDHKQVA